MPDFMGSIGRYVFRTTFGAFVLVLVSLTIVIWITQALREIDLMTSQGQTILVFIGMTGLLVPVLVLVIAPVAFVVAVAYTLNKLNSDSEIVVMNATGMSPWRLFLPFLAVALVVSLLIASISAYLAPKSLRSLRDWTTRVRADFVTTILQPGRFTTIENGLTFHIRERRPSGELAGILIDDRRDPNERATFLAEIGEIMRTDRGTFLVLETGSVQRQEANQRDPTIVVFDRYAFDLSRFTGAKSTRHVSARERYFWDLTPPNPNDSLFAGLPTQTRDEYIAGQAAQIHAEFHDRMVAPLYPIAFVVVVFAILGAPSTTRQSRAFALGAAVAVVATLRFIGFGSTIFAARTPAAVLVTYAVVAIAIVLGLWAIRSGLRIEGSTAVNRLVAAIARRLPRRAAAT